MKTPISFHKPPTWLRILQAAILLHFVLEVFYTGYETMIVLRPPGAGFGPLGAAAITISDSLFLKRRLYAIEHWIAFSGLALFLAVTEMLPRLLRPRILEREGESDQ